MIVQDKVKVEKNPQISGPGNLSNYIFLNFSFLPLGHRSNAKLDGASLIKSGKYHGESVGTAVQHEIRIAFTLISFQQDIGI